MTESKTNNQKISEGIILALTSGCAYLFTFYYETGFASVFNIPVSFINVSLTTALTFWAIFIGVIASIYPVTELLFAFTIRNARPIIRQTLMPIVLMVIFLLVQISIFGIENWRHWFIFLEIFIVLLFIQLIFPLITQRKGKFVDKLEAQLESDRQSTDIAKVVQEKFGNNYLVVIITILTGVIVASTAGTAEALRQTEFLVTNTNPGST